MVLWGKEAGLSQRVQAVEGSMHAPASRDGCFDVVWIEGAIFAIGFSNACRSRYSRGRRVVPLISNATSPTSAMTTLRRQGKDA